ncbi:MAG: putative cell wall-binding domain [bacterium]|nr:putative cell wall-binding domain [bacterium]
MGDSSRSRLRARPASLTAVSMIIAAALSFGGVMTASPAGASGYSEQEGHHGANTFTDYHNASGMGPRVDAASWVDVSCKVYDPYIQSVNPDGYWYRIASAPWNDQYYAAANTFMNGDPWNGPYTHNTDWNVPDCGAPLPPPPPPPPSPHPVLTQGPGASIGFWYAIALDGFPGGSDVSVTCYDSVSPAGFRSFSIRVDSAGNASFDNECRSNDGSDHWVVAGGVESNHVSWGARPTPPPTSGQQGNQAPPSTSGGGSPGGGGSGSPPTTNSGGSSQPVRVDACLAIYGSGSQATHGIFGGTETDYDRVASLYQQCEGFGAPAGLNLSAEMKCALIAAAAAYAGFPTNQAAKSVCDALGVVDTITNGGWLTSGADYACGLFSEAFATGVGIFAAGAASETGPGAVEVGVQTYRALNAALTVACAGLFAGGASALGQKLEANHETHIALDIATQGKCLRERRVFGLIFWSAATC